MSDERILAASRLRDFVADLFVAAGVSPRAALKVAQGLVDADIEGLHSHGVMLVDMYIDRLRHGSVSNRETASTVSSRGGAVVLDAGHALGHLTGEQAMAIAVGKAREFASGIVSVRHGFHFGTAGKYALQAANADCIGIAMCNTRPLMPAPGGAERVVGNNPIAIAVPTNSEIPLLLDMATSEAAMGKIRMADKSKTPIPASWAVTASGEPTTDAAAAISGMLLPSGGPKGFGLSFMIDLMSGLLSQGAIGSEVRPLYGDMTQPYDCSHLFIAIDVAHFCDVQEFRARAAAAAAGIRNGARAPGTDQLYSPGEPEWRRRQQANGQVSINPAVIAMLTRFADEYGISSACLAGNTEEKHHG